MSAELTWDVFESESLSVRRGQSQAAIRAALATGELTEDDLARPAGSSTPWKRLGDCIAEWPAEAATPAPAPPQVVLEPPISEAKSVQAPDTSKSSLELQALEWLSDKPEPTAAAKPAQPVESPRPGATTAPARAPQPIVDAGTDQYEHEEGLLEPSIVLEPFKRDGADLVAATEDDEEEDFTLSRSSVEKVEELDLAAMVDVAFQLVLFFMVTASVTLIKSMELPKPTESTKPAAASAPGIGSRNKNEVESDFIVVAINADGEIRVEDEPAVAEQLVERLREARTATGKTGMILRAENKTLHRTAVAAYDAANAIGLRIAIEREIAP